MARKERGDEKGWIRSIRRRIARVGDEAAAVAVVMEMLVVTAVDMERE